MGETQEDGRTRRAVLEASAARGNPVAVAALEGPECPDTMYHLVEWAIALVGRSGADMSGHLLPLAHREVLAWSMLSGQVPAPHEVAALMTLDSALRTKVEDQPVVVTTQTPRNDTAWPTKLGAH